MKPTLCRSGLMPILILTGCLGSVRAPAAEVTPAAQQQPAAPAHLQPLALGEIGTTPWSFSPEWFVLLAIAVPGITWLGFAWKRALDEDPQRLRRSGIRELRRLLSHIRRSRTCVQPLHLHGWCRAAARTWGVRVSAPTGGEVTRSLHTLTGDATLTSTWRELWSGTERGLYAADATAPSDWLERASLAAAEVEVPKRERWLPNRLAHWLPALAMVMLAITCAVAGSARAAQEPPTTATLDPQLRQAQAAAQRALGASWNDWAAHYNIAAFAIQEGQWNAAVAHATAAFLQHPSSTANRDNLRFALQQAGTLDPTLRRLLYGAWYQRIPALLSPAGWQRLAFAASLLLAAGLTAMVLALYLTHNRRYLTSGGRSGLAAGALLLITAVMAWNAYGTLNQPSAGILLVGVNLSPAPTELVPEQETSPLPAGSVVLPQRSFLGWQQISSGGNASGWVRKNAVMPFYGSPRH
ncbi:MAG: hypothetical protein JWN85_4663 [Gammaproteobacteria bacterium]|nr:hypothetical protein [Gammaproteobacteria bacterium]